MAKINNQAVMQKLIDDLKLYPGKDLIPSELADKILAVFTINEQEVDVTVKKEYVLWQDLATDDPDKTFTVPADHTYIINSCFIKYNATATVGNRRVFIKVKDTAGELIFFGGEEANIVASRNYNINCLAHAPYFTDLFNGPVEWDQGGDGQGSEIFFPMPFVMKAGYTIQIYDSRTIDALDDMKVSMIVQDIAD